ncbi:MAG: hypothetical protein SNJ57_13115 [Cyanobacteriota bacterium]
MQDLITSNLPLIILIIILITMILGILIKTIILGIRIAISAALLFLLLAGGIAYLASLS